jgi:hypothetical protein
MQLELRGVLAMILLTVASWATELRATVIDFDDVPGIGERRISRDRYLSQGVYFPPPVDGAFVDGPSALTDTPPNWLAGPHVLIQFMVPGTRTPGVTDSVSFRVTFLGDPEGADTAFLALYGLGEPFEQGALLEERVVPPENGFLVSLSRPAKDIHGL